MISQGIISIPVSWKGNWASVISHEKFSYGPGLYMEYTTSLTFL